MPSNAIDDGDDPRAESTGAASSVALSGAISDTPPDAAASPGPAPPPPGGPCARTEAGQRAGRARSLSATRARRARPRQRLEFVTTSGIQPRSAASQRGGTAGGPGRSRAPRGRSAGPGRAPRAAAAPRISPPGRAGIAPILTRCAARKLRTMLSRAAQAGVEGGWRPRSAAHSGLLMGGRAGGQGAWFWSDQSEFRSSPSRDMSS